MAMANASVAGLVSAAFSRVIAMKQELRLSRKEILHSSVSTETSGAAWPRHAFSSSVVQESITLLKNDDGLLPLSRDRVRNVIFLYALSSVVFL